MQEKKSRSKGWFVEFVQHFFVTHESLISITFSKRQTRYFWYVSNWWRNSEIFLLQSSISFTPGCGTVKIIQADNQTSKIQQKISFEQQFKYYIVISHIRKETNLLLIKSATFLAIDWTVNFKFLFHHR
jgi:hypothetical protein